MTMNLFDLLEQSAKAGLTLQNADGSLPPGHNGPYHDPETPVRNTAHWLITFLWAHNITHDERYQNAANLATDYLASDAARPQKATFYHRTNPKKDASNGLIGQAWSIEALVAAATGLERPECSQLATEVFLLHPFDEATALWDRIDITGHNIGVDPTFNHQLWFAASGALLVKQGHQTIGDQVRHFLDHLETHLALYPSGLIRHRHPDTVSQGEVNSERWHHRSVGYHAFNLYAFALLQPIFPQHPFWQSELFKALWAYTHTDDHKQAVAKNDYGYRYNPVGIEVAFALEKFSKNAQSAQTWWLSEQCRRSFNKQQGLMNQNTEDPATHAARIYEATRLPDLPLPE